jgi:predicted  nucleic acid-binding Zn-ribbon protein
MSKDFYYSWTCPKIDENIRKFRSELTDHIDNLVKELNPMFYDISPRRYVDDWIDSVFNSAEGIFENVRECNSDMRDEANRVVKELIEERDEYKRLAELWEDESNEKDKQIQDLQEEIEELKEQLNDR